MASSTPTPSRVETKADRSRKVVQYSDFTNQLDTNPMTGSVALVTNEADVVQSMKNLLSLNKYERPYEPTVYSGVQALLFENDIDGITAGAIQQQIEQVIGNCESRARLSSVTCEPYPSESAFVVTVTFTLVNSNTPITFTHVLKAVR